MKVKDLPIRPAYRVFLYCAACGEQNSATKGDYFMADPNTTITHCGEPMTLVQERRTLTEVRH